MPHVASMLPSESQRNQVCDRSRILIECTLLQFEEVEQIFVVEVEFTAFTNTWSKPRLWLARDKTRSDMAWNQRLLWLLRLFFWLFNPWFVPLKFLDFSSFWIAPHLLIRSKFTSPVVFLTHIFSPAFCLSSAQKRSLNGQSPPALPQFRQVLLAGWLGIGGHLRFLQQLT